MLGAAIVVHGGAGQREPELEGETAAGCARAAAAGWAVLERGGAALDAALEAVVLLEDAPVFNAGVGSCLSADGTVEMDASVMDGATGTGAGVALVRTVRNPIRLAHAVWRAGRHVLLAAHGAEAFARRQGLPTADNESFITARQRQRWTAWRAGNDPGAGGTVGAVTVDSRGHVAAATSTGGMRGKLPGRVGDTAIVGAGTFADDAAGAASATGHGETIMLAGLASRAVDHLRAGRDPDHAARAVIAELGRGGRAGAGIIVVDRFGRCGWAYDTEHMACHRRAAQAFAA